LTAEEKLLISLCRLEFSEEQKAEIRELMKEVKDWDRFVDISNRHGVIALCWYNLKEPGNSYYVPARQLEILHSAYLKNLTRNTFIYKNLEEIASLAVKENIKIVLLKGAALEKTVYGNQGLRQMSDIDILVRQDEASSLRGILLKKGFESAPLVSSFHEKIMPAYGKHLPEMYKNGIAVEIHFKLFDQKGNTLTTEFLNKAVRVSDTGTNLHSPEPQLFFLYLLKHLDKHEKSGYFQLRLYTDLAVLLSVHSEQIFNESLFEYALQANLETVLAEKLKLLQLYWGISLPEPAKSFTEKLNPHPGSVKFTESLRCPNNDQQEEKKESLFYLLNNVPGIKNRILLIFGHIFPSVAYIKFRYNIKTKTGAVLYYPVRWVNQVGKILGIKA
jgi:hypothetical protein